MEWSPIIIEIYYYPKNELNPIKNNNDNVRNVFGFFDGIWNKFERGLVYFWSFKYFKNVIKIFLD